MVKLECKVSVLKSLIVAISKIINEVVLVCTSKGVKLQSMDSNHVGLIMLSLPKSTFTKYTCKLEKSVENEQIPINLPSLLKILDCAQANDSCVLSTDPKTPDIIDIELTNETRSFEYSMKLMDLEYAPIDIPTRDDDAIITFPSGVFQNLIKDLMPLGVDAHITADADTISFGVESDSGKGKYTIEYKDNNVECSEFEEAVTQMFSLKYLSDFSKACSFCQRVELRLKDEHPLIMRFALPKMSICNIDLDDNANYGTLLFFLAPKMDGTD